MARAGVKAKAGKTSVELTARREHQAFELASMLPDLMIEAKQIAMTIAHGIHGRRRAGPGETFWQFRPYEQTDSSSLIDWRRTASSNGVFVREREWEAAHTVWLWPDLSKSMDFQSHLSNTPKRERAVVLMLALAELLVRGGERVGLLGITRPSASRYATSKLAEQLGASAHDPVLTSGLAPAATLQKYSAAVLFSDFLDPPDEIGERLKTLARNGVGGHLIQVLDPAEESLPYDGRVEFFSSDGGEMWITERAQSIREAYLQKLNAHRESLRQLCHNLGWSFLVHHTDRPASEPLLTLITRMQGGNDVSHARGHTFGERPGVGSRESDAAPGDGAGVAVAPGGGSVSDAGEHS